MGDEPELNDPVLRSEIELVGDLVVAAAEFEGPMPQEAIDHILATHVLATHARPGPR